MLQKMRKAMGKRGVAMVEYAVLLAFVAVVAAVYLDTDNDSSLSSGISKQVSKTVSRLN